MEVRVNARVLIALLLVISGVLVRVIPHEPNFAPVGALAVFAGAALGWRHGWWVPLAIMAVSDAIIGFYPGVWMTWLGFVAVGLYGALLSRAGFLKQAGLGALGSAAIFYVISNFGTWLTSGMYAHTWAGLIECYYLAVPFLRASLLADVIYSFALFGLYALAVHVALTYERRRAQKVPAV